MVSVVPSPGVGVGTSKSHSSDSVTTLPRLTRARAALPEPWARPQGLFLLPGPLGCARARLPLCGAGWRPPEGAPAVCCSASS